MNAQRVVLLEKRHNEYVAVHRDRLAPGQTVENFIRKTTEAGIVQPGTQLAVLFLNDIRLMFAYTKPTKQFTVNMAPYTL